jgi:hypothetical protein
MLNGKIGIIVLITAVIGIALLYKNNNTVQENFWNIPSRSWKVEKVLANQTPCGPDFYQTPGFQGILNPRFSNADYGPNLRTQLPDYGMMGVPSDPLGGNFGGSQNANCSGPPATYVEGFEPAYQNNTGYDNEFEMQRVLMDPHNPSSYASGNYKDVVCSLTPGDLSDDQNPVIPSGSFLTANGEMKQPIIYDRFIYANRHSRLRAMGDPIRGDLPIVPISGNWFVPSVHPNIDLHAGGINVLGGVNNETNHQLASLIYASSGGGDTTIGGVDLLPQGGVDAFSRMNMCNQNMGATVSAGGDVIMTSFP